MSATEKPAAPESEAPATPTDPKTEARAAHSTFTAQQVEAMRFERIKSLFGLTTVLASLGPQLGTLLGLLSQIDLSKLPALITAINGLLAVADPFGSAAGLKNAIAAALKLARVFVGMTPGETDDQLLDKIDQIAQGGPLFDMLVNLVAGAIAHPKAQGSVSVMSADVLSDNINANHEKQMQAAGIDFATILAIVQMIVAILGSFKGLFPAKGTQPALPSA